MRAAGPVAAGLVWAIKLLWLAGGAEATSCVNSYGLSLSSCDDAASAFSSIGCTCYLCVETNGNVDLQCTASNKTCYDTIYDSQADSTLEAPSLNSKHYAVIWVVYIVVALLLAGLTRGAAYWSSRPKASEVNTAAKVGDVVLVDAAAKEEITDKVKGWLKKFVMYPLLSIIKPDNDSFDALLDVFGDLNKWAGLLIPVVCMFKRAPAKKVRHSKRQAFLKIVTELLITLSLAFMLGTVVFNNESCSATHSVQACSTCVCDTLCGGVSVGCKSDCSCFDASDFSGGCNPRTCLASSSTSVSDSLISHQSIVRESGDVSYTTGAEATNVILTEVFAIAMGIGVRSAKKGSPRQGLLYLAALLVAIALGGFGWFYASSIAKEQVSYDETYMDRRIKAISAVLLASWWTDQLVDFGKASLLCGIGWLAYRMSDKKPNEKLAANAGAGSVVRPHGAHLDEPVPPNNKHSQASVAAPVPPADEAAASDVVITETNTEKQGEQ